MKGYWLLQLLFVFLLIVGPGNRAPAHICRGTSAMITTGIIGSIRGTISVIYINILIHIPAAGIYNDSGIALLYQGKSRPVIGYI